VSLARVKQKGQVTIPATIRAQIGLAEGDYVEVKRQGRRIVLTPKEVVDRHPEVDAALAEGLADARAGRVTPKFANMKEYQTWLKTPEGKAFARR
jgi:AbrB family looped-hinge helix DNA binding protein